MRATKRKKSTSQRTETSARSGRSSKNLAMGVDIGGTKIAAGLVDRFSGEIRAHIKAPMVACGRPAEGLAAVQAAIDLLLKNAAMDIRAIHAMGLCAPGPVDPHSGVILNPPNVPCWRNFPLAAEISRAYRIPVRLDKDANAAALAETLWGAARGYQNVFYATIGTGIGTGIVLHGKIHRGRTGAAGEGGHVSIDCRGPKCNCGKPGCIETLAAGPAIAKATQLQLKKRPGDSQILLELAGGDADAVTSEMVGQAYAKGDRIAHDVLNQTLDYLSFWLGNIIDLLEPEIIVIGGGVSLMLKPFFKELSKRLAGRCLNRRGSEISIVPSHYGEDAGVAGAAALCLEHSVKA